MRRVLLGALIAGAVAAPALAADLPASFPAKAPAYVPAFSWTGTYVGLNVGGVWGNFDFDPLTTNNLTGASTAIPRTTLNDSAVIGGFQTGYNWQFGRWVLGFEQDAQFTNLKTGFTYAVPPGGALVVGDSLSSKVDYMGATRAKVGVAWDRALLYAAGGLETAILDTTGTFVARGAGGSPALSFTDANKFYTGWTIGAGIDYAMTNNVFLGVDYRYFDLGGQTFNLGAVTAAGVPSTVSTNVNLRGNEVTARLNVKLNGLGFFGM